MRAKVTHRLPRVGPLCCVPLAARTSHRPNNAKSHTRAGNALGDEPCVPARPARIWASAADTSTTISILVL
eukprot:7378953-Prymnesium_polylepis.1